MASVHRLLVCGELVEVQLGSTFLSVKPRGGNNIHIVNVGPPVAVEARAGCSHSFALSYGGTAIIEFPEGTREITIHLDTVGPALNHTEQAFAREVRQVLKAASATSGPTSSTNRCLEGAAPLSVVASKCCARKPTHANEMIASLNEINSFEGAGGEKLCVAKKRAKPRTLAAQCPRLERGAGIDTIARRASNGEALWRQCAASFSTMMRHFQKSPSAFRWASDSEKRTIISRTCGTTC